MEKKIIEGQDLENVSGGNNYVVNTGDSRNAAIRVAPGLNSQQVGSLPNGTVANTTGNFAKADGRTWHRSIIRFSDGSRRAFSGLTGDQHTIHAEIAQIPPAV